MKKLRHYAGTEQTKIQNEEHFIACAVLLLHSIDSELDLRKEQAFQHLSTTVELLRRPKPRYHPKYQKYTFEDAVGREKCKQILDVGDVNVQ